MLTPFIHRQLQWQPHFSVRTATNGVPFLFIQNRVSRTQQRKLRTSSRMRTGSLWIASQIQDFVGVHNIPQLYFPRRRLIQVLQDSALTRLIGTVVGEVFPSHGGFLDVAVYNATGLSQTKGVRKTSLRLVWPGILIDADRAVRDRDPRDHLKLLVGQFWSILVEFVWRKTFQYNVKKIFIAFHHLFDTNQTAKRSRLLPNYI